MPSIFITKPIIGRLIFLKNERPAAAFDSPSLKRFSH